MNLYRYQRLVATADFDYFGSVFWGQNSMSPTGLDTVATAYNAITGTPDSMHEFSFAAPAGTRWSARAGAADRRLTPATARDSRSRAG